MNQITTQYVTEAAHALSSMLSPTPWQKLP